MIELRRALWVGLCLALSCGGEGRTRHPEPDPAPSARPAPSSPLDALNDDQLFLYELQEDYASWAERRGTCAASDPCWVYGSCSPSPEGCRAKTSMDCLWSSYCAMRWHHCTVKDGKCVLTEDRFYPWMSQHPEGGHGERVVGYLFDRPVLNRTLHFGLCSIQLEPPPYEARNLLACRWSEACLMKAMCRLDEGTCRVDPFFHELRFERPPDSVVPPTKTGPPDIFSAEAARDFRFDLIGPPEHWRATRGACGDSTGCFEEGRCSSNDGNCIARRVIDCLFSTACRDRGLCRPEAGRCVAGGKRLFERVTPSAEEHAQRPGRAPQNAPVCSHASNILECRHSHECAREGRCHFNGHRCVAATDGGCRQSAGCRDERKCHFDPDATACVARD